MYGAGNIGRGFIGQLFSQSGYETVFIDVDVKIVDAMNAAGRYPVKVVSEKGNDEILVEHVRAVNGRDAEAAAREIAGADVMATAVGVNVLPRIAATIAGGLALRWKNGNAAPLNIIICENLIGADRFLADLVGKELDETGKGYLKTRIGFVEASIGRMVPVMSPEMQGGNPLAICVEPYDQLPVDKDAFVGTIPTVRNMVPFSPFEFYIQRKLFIHNMGHAMTAYLGSLKGCRFIWEAIADPEIRETVGKAMEESAQALSREHGVALEVVMDHVRDLLDRFGNRQLGDTVERVGRDLSRKLAPNDRLVGALNLCLAQGVDPAHICIGLAAALRFKDPASDTVPALLVARGPEAVLGEVCGLKPGTREWNAILSAYKAM
jgi:mannitol-1-phosphate 5-dehydrogenase